MQLPAFRSSPNYKLYGLLLAGLAIYILYSILAGLPSNANMGGFILGLGVLFASVVGLFLVSWYLLFKPLPAGLKPSPVMPFSARSRQMMAILLVIMSVAGVVGGLWDAVWHASYGIPFGEDFFWRPHQFIYASLFTPIALGFLIAFQTMRKGKGTLQQRFRADMPLSLIMVSGIFMAFVLPSDPIWHLIYAEDLTGLSVPHTLFSVVNTILQVGFLSIFVSYTPERQDWESVLKAKLADWMILLISANILMVLFLLSLSDWEAANSPANIISHLPAILAARPNWAIPALLGFIATWVGFIATHASKRFGMATATMILGFIIRQSLFLIFQNTFYGYETWFLIAPLLVAIDVLVYWGVRQKRVIPAWQIALALTVVGLLFSLPQMSLNFSEILIGLGDLPMIGLMLFLTSFTGTWMGRTVGDYIANAARHKESLETRVFEPALLRTTAILIVVIVCASVWFIFTAVTPLA